MSDVYKRKELPDLFQTTVQSLHEYVPYIDWVGIYYFERQENMKLVAASDLEEDLTWEANGELKFPLKNSSNEAIGIMVVRSREAIAFDVTDVATLETIAQSLGEMSLAN